MNEAIIHDISRKSFEEGVTSFNVEAFIDLMDIANKNMGDVKLIQVHPIVFTKASRNNLFDYEPNTFLGVPVEEYKLSDEKADEVQAVYIHLKNGTTLTLLTREY